MNAFDFNNNYDYKSLTTWLRMFNEKICVVEINIKVINENESQEVKTRKIQSNLLFIQLKYGESTRNTSTSGTITQRGAIINRIFTS